MSNIYFVLILMIILLLFNISDKKNNKFLLIISTIFLSLIVGLRGETIGIDTSDYYYAFNNSFPLSWQFKEMGFRFISIFLMRSFGNAMYLMIIYSFITQFCIILRLWDFRKKTNFTLMIFLYLLIYYLNTMNIMRQYICIAIIFFSTKLLEKKKYIPFLIIVVLCATIHTSSLLALFFLLMYVWGNLNKRKKILFFVPIIMVSAIALTFVIKYESGHILNYFSDDNSIENFNITFLYRILIFFISFILMKFNKKIVWGKSDFVPLNNYENISKKEFNRISLIYFLGLAFSSMGMFFSFMTRFGLFYLIFEIVYWGCITKNNKNKKLNILMISIYAIYIFIIELLLNGSGIFPYYFNL